MLHTASFEDIKAGKITDVYFRRTMQIMQAKGLDRPVRAEFIAKSLPKGWEWAVLAGIEECARVLEGLKVSVRAMEEGTVFRPFQPVMEIAGMYSQFAVYETALLGLLCQASGIATQAARCRVLAGHRLLASFGARRMHPAIAPMIERAAYIGGCDGVSVVASAQLLGEEPMGTMPHALILLIGSTVEAARAFHEVVEPTVRRVALIDTFNDEKFEALNVAEALGQDLFAVRLDTPGSRRGNFRQILEEVRWELDLRGYQHVRLFVSGGIKEEDIRELNPLVDAYGIGTEISNASTIDLSMDIVEVEGKPLAKRGKLSGSKSVWRCSEGIHDAVTPRGVQPEHPSTGLPTGPAYRTGRQAGSGQRPDCPGTFQEILVPLTADSRLVRELPRPQEIRAQVLAQLEHLSV